MTERKKLIAEVIDYISKDQGWEETGDKYRKHFGLKKVYKKVIPFHLT